MPREAPMKRARKARGWWIVEPFGKWWKRTFCDRPEGARQWVIDNPEISCEIVRVREVLAKSRRNKR